MHGRSPQGGRRTLRQLGTAGPGLLLRVVAGARGLGGFGGAVRRLDPRARAHSGSGLRRGIEGCARRRIEGAKERVKGARVSPSPAYAGGSSAVSDSERAPGGVTVEEWRRDMTRCYWDSSGGSILVQVVWPVNTHENVAERLLGGLGPARGCSARPEASISWGRVGFRLRPRGPYLNPSPLPSRIGSASASMAKQLSGSDAPAVRTATRPWASSRELNKQARAARQGPAR